MGYSVIDSYIAVAMQLVSTVVLARLLTPQEFGTFAVAAAFTALASSVRSFGISEYLIQDRQLSPATMRAALAVSVTAAWALGLLLNLIAPIVGRFYANAEMATVLHVQSVAFFITPLGSLTMAYFRREMQMRLLFVCNLAGHLAAFAVGIAMAWAGFGTLSLAWPSVAAAVITVVVAIWLTPANVPRWPSLRGALPIFRSGWHLSGIFLFGQLGAGAPEMIVGKAAGVASVAFLSRAQGLVELFHRLILQSIWPVVLPALAKANRETGGMASAYLKGVSYLTAVAWPILAWMALLAYPLVRIVYGDQWLESVGLAQVLCVAAAVAVAHHFGRDALLALGLARECNALQFRIQLLRVAGILAGLPFGILGVCWGIVVASLLGAMLTQRALSSGTGLTSRQAASAWWPSVQITAVTVAPAGLLLAAVPPSESNSVAVGLGAAIVTVPAWLFALRALRHPLWRELTAWRHALRRNALPPRT